MEAFSDTTNQTYDELVDIIEDELQIDKAEASLSLASLNSMKTETKILSDSSKSEHALSSTRVVVDTQV